jgi:tetratricopeptide (TPR) repeat protein/tRNA A-37 threonylcarbamoyl transferase component Bud32
MDPRRELAEQIFLAALDVNPAERDAVLNERCGKDTALRGLVEDMLARHARAGSFLEHPPLDFLAGETRTIDGNEIPPTPAPAGRLMSGQILNGRFVIVRFIAKGGMGEVYEAADPFLQGVHIALKTILPHMADHPALQQRFVREVLLAREVTHPNLCPIHDIFHCEEPPPSFLFLTMKLLPGETLAARLRGPVSISVEEGLAICKQMAAGLLAIHGAGVVHRDIKPNNIMLDGSGADVRLWITDFGLARAFETEPTIQGKEVVAGTPGYIAPELFLGQQPSQASDLYAFGVVLHVIFTGQKPTAAEDGSSVVVSSRLNASGVPSYCADLVRGCLDRNPERRCEAFERALESLDLKKRQRRLWTRRQFAVAAAATAFTLSGGAWMERDELYNLTHPIPPKRFVALLNWPRTSDAHVMPMLTGALTAIKSELARLEAFDRNLFVISPEDLNQDLTRASQLKEVCDPLGANLALAASGIPGVRYFELVLRLLDPFSNRTIRKREIKCALADITSLPDKAVKEAAALLNLSHYLKSTARTEPGTQSIAAFTAFQQAETLRKQPNDAGLNASIEKYREAVEVDPQYAMAYAKLAQTYVRRHAIQRDPGILEVARRNCERALELDPSLVEGHLGLSLVLEYTGDEQGALDEISKALTLDPSNPKALLWQAQIFDRLNRWSDAEKTYRRVLKERPNYWVTYNELGTLYQEQGRYKEAVQAYRSATAVAPGSAQAQWGLGTAYLQTGDFAAATESLKKSLALAPNKDEALANTSLALRYQGNYDEALPYALKAVQVDPANDASWLELGDCYSSLHNRKGEAKDAYLRAAKEVERHLQTDPTDGPSWMLLALYRVKSGSPQEALSLIQKAEPLGASDMDSQLYKARILEQLGRRDDALATLATCFRKGASALQITPFPDMQALRKDPRYRQMAQSRATAGGYVARSQ